MTPLTNGCATPKCWCSIPQPCESRSWALPTAAPHGNPPLPNPSPHLLFPNPSPAKIVLKDPEKIELKSSFLHNITTRNHHQLLMENHFSANHQQSCFHLIALTVNVESSVVLQRLTEILFSVLFCIGLTSLLTRHVENDLSLTPGWRKPRTAVPATPTGTQGLQTCSSSTEHNMHTLYVSV